MLTWCSSAVSFCFLSFLAASRTRSSPVSPLSRPGVRHRLGSCVFSSVCGLSSTPSAGDGSLLFGCFAGTMPQYDSSALKRRAPVHEGITAHRVPPPARSSARGRKRGLSVLAHGVSLRAWGLRLRRIAVHSRLSHTGRVAFWEPDAIGILKRLFRSSIPSLQIPLSNASSAASRLPSHGSGPEWFAIPSLYDSFIHYFMPVAPKTSTTSAGPFD